MKTYLFPAWRALYTTYYLCVVGVSKKELAKFERRCVEVARRSIAVMGEAAARSANMSKLAGKYRK